MGFLRRLFGRDIKTDTAVQNGYTLVADDTKTSGIDWSDVLVRGGLGRDLADGINYAADIDTTVTPGKYSFDGSTAGDTPGTAGNFEVRERDTTIFQVAQTDDNKLLSRSKIGATAWSAWKEMAGVGAIVTPQLSKIQYVYNGGGGYNWTVPTGVTRALFILQSGSTAKGSGGQRYVSGGYITNYYFLNPNLHDIRTVYLESLTAGQVVELVIGRGELVYDPMLTDYYNGYIITSDIAEPTTLTSPIGTVYSTGAPINESMDLHLTPGGAPLSDYRHAALRVDGRMYTTGSSITGDPRESHGTLYSGDAGSVTILYG